mmetsp:Transcript_26565/g.47869  ORF Transcript_26565/g.47869 Transcript_26565/m.47869 type:complete len:106 (-) Transcript_26565:159-476(-)
MIHCIPMQKYEVPYVNAYEYGERLHNSLPDDAAGSSHLGHEQLPDPDPPHDVLEHDEDVVKEYEVQYTPRSNAIEPVPHKGHRDRICLGEQAFHVGEESSEVRTS